MIKKKLKFKFKSLNFFFLVSKESPSLWTEILIAVTAAWCCLCTAFTYPRPEFLWSLAVQLNIPLRLTKGTLFEP